MTEKLNPSEYTEEEMVQMGAFGIKRRADKPVPGSMESYVPGAREGFKYPEQPKTQEQEKITSQALEISKLKEEIERLKRNRGLTFDEYSKERILAQGNQHNSKVEDFGLACMGLAGEVGEFSEIIKKHFFYGKELNRYKALTELGDILWYINYAANLIGSSLEEVAKINNVKLRQRYPNGFDVNIAKHLGMGNEIY